MNKLKFNFQWAHGLWSAIQKISEGVLRTYVRYQISPKESIGHTSCWFQVIGFIRLPRDSPGIFQWFQMCFSKDGINRLWKNRQFLIVVMANWISDVWFLTYDFFTPHWDDFFLHSWIMSFWACRRISHFIPKGLLWSLLRFKKHPYLGSIPTQ